VVFEKLQKSVRFEKCPKKRWNLKNFKKRYEFTKVAKNNVN